MKSNKISAWLTGLFAKLSAWLTQGLISLAWIQSKRTRVLEARIEELEHALFQSQQFEQIAAEKLKVWVQKHDDILIAYNQLKWIYESPSRTQP